MRVFERRNTRRAYRNMKHSSRLGDYLIYVFSCFKMIHIIKYSIIQHCKYSYYYNTVIIDACAEFVDFTRNRVNIANKVDSVCVRVQFAFKQRLLPKDHAASTILFC
jgi:hypothetical protein